MIIWRDAVVESLGPAWPGVQEVRARITAGSSEPSSSAAGASAPAAGASAPAAETPALAAGAEVRALAYTALVGTPAVGDRVTLTCSALARGLGTGGYALVAALPDALPADPPAGPGHLVKARYTPLQPLVLGVDEQESPDHETLREADDLAGMPVVVADLHSALPAIVAGLRSEAAALGLPVPRVAYVMTDGGALPAWFSRAAAGLREAGWIAGTVTVGQAFGGDLEAVTLHTGLLAARLVLGADVAVVTQGPGNLGTGTRWGFSGVAAGEAVNAAAVLGGRPVASLRVSAADARGRHRGLSHHSTTAYGRVALAVADIVVPTAAGLADEGAGGYGEADGERGGEHGGAGVGAGGAGGDHGVRGAYDGELEREVTLAAGDLCTPIGRHRFVPVALTGLRAALEDSPVRLSTMGRGLGEDASPFLAAAAAGRWAARILAPVRGTVWHLALADDWALAQRLGAYAMSTRGARLADVGFVHASSADQVDGVANAFYADLASEGAVALEIDADVLAGEGIACVLEPGDPRDQTSQRFPHVYGEVPVEAVRRALPWRGTLTATLGG
ncbi:DUF3866 family protein [Miniimonas arenae]|uniref:DUF3866 family protein n=1 Tax=Miniimonas arenae TaxID=676201 RepID=A0A5C5B8T5_9MICO|nr:DUF3866 family protein [Miniimonas arenae]